MNASELLPCPFCGKKLTDDDLPDAFHWSGLYWRFDEELGRHYVNNSLALESDNPCWELSCLATSGGCGVTMSGDSSEEVIEKWNARTSDCKLPPDGWSCSRGDGHEGPCAARPIGGYVEKEILTNREIEISFLGTNFGSLDKRKLLESSLLKIMVGFHCGGTITSIMKKLGLITKNETPTKKGKMFVSEAQKELLSRSG